MGIIMPSILPGYRSPLAYLSRLCLARDNPQLVLKGEIDRRFEDLLKIGDYAYSFTAFEIRSSITEGSDSQM